MNRPLRGLYLLADESIRPFEQWAELLPALLAQPLALVQYRAKALPPARQRAHAGALLAACVQAGVPLLINDDPALAQEIGAQGVHLGRDDAALQGARERLGPEALIGVSCYDDLARAHAAASKGASYVSFGRLYLSQTKPQASPARLDTLRQARRSLAVPICGIGGIHPGNAAAVLSAGADLICVGAGILGAADPVAAARKLATICDPT